MKNNLLSKRNLNKRPFIAILLFIFGLIISSGWQSAHAAGAVSLIGSSLSQQVIPHTSSGRNHVFSNYVVPAGTERLLVVAAATSIEADIWEKATYGSTEMIYATAHHDGFGTGVSIWVLPLGSSTTAESAQSITLSHFSGSTLYTDAEFVAVAVFENVDQSDPVAPTPTIPTPPGARRFGIVDDGFPSVTNATLTVPSEPGDLIFSIYAAYNNGGNGHPANNAAGGQTVRHTATATSDSSGCGNCYHADFRWTTSTKPGTSGTDTVNYTDTPLAWVHGALNLNQSTNLPPSITSNNSASVDENQTSAIDVASNDDSDSEGSGLTYSLTGGADVNRFNIDSSSGLVTFKTAPDYEIPADVDMLNDYEIQVTVADSGGLTAVQSITINVNDVFECAGVPSTASNETELNQAIECYNEATTGGYTVSIQQNITLTGDTTAFNNQMGATLQINGGGYMLDGVDSYRLIRVNNGEITINNWILEDGFVSSGSPIYVENGSDLILDQVVVQSSTGSLGGAVQNRGITIIRHSTIDSNTATFRGGGVYNFPTGSLTIDNSTLSNNQATNGGGGLYGSGFTLNVTNSTISGNQAPTGGGIHTSDGQLALTNSTVSGNTATAAGGGLFNEKGTITVRQATISNNSAPAGAGISSSNEFGTLTNLEGSIVSGNTVSPAGGSELQPHGGTSDTFSSNGYNVVGSVDANVTINATGDQTAVSDPSIAALADNGCATIHKTPIGDACVQTHALQDGSPAIDNSNNAICVATPVSNLDQREIARPQGTTCDVGAFERRTAVSPVLSITSTPEFSWTPSQAGCTYTLWYATSPYGTYTQHIGTPNSYDLTTALTNNSANYFYLQVVCPDDSIESNRLGAFTFDIVPGS
ncbi:MAG: choice-of-anchor Q domain-containing protein [Chloroflexota bacterium]